MDSLNKIDVIEFFFDIKKGLAHNEIVSEFENHIEKIISCLPNKGYIFTSDFKKGIKSKIRSYKGLNNKLDKEHFISSEIEFDNNYSLIAGIIDVNENFNMYRSAFYDSSIRFFISTSRVDFYSIATIKEIVNNCMSHRSTSALNYANIALKYLAHPDDVLMRVSGDGGINYFSVQLFVNKNYTNNILEILKTLEIRKK
jgi:hypothetical protein